MTGLIPEYAYITTDDKTHGAKSLLNMPVNILIMDTRFKLLSKIVNGLCTQELSVLGKY